MKGQTEPLAVTDAHVAQARRYPMLVAEEDGYWVARVPGPDFPYVLGAGASPEEAAAELVNGLATVLAGLEREGQTAVAPVSDYSGHLNARLPRSLHRALAQRAAVEGLSVNATLTYLLTQALSGDMPGAGPTSTG